MNYTKKQRQAQIEILEAVKNRLCEGELSRGGRREIDKIINELNGEINGNKSDNRSRKD